MTMDTSAQERQNRYGWQAHAGSACGRCGAALGPFHFDSPNSQELWGCAECGVGVAFGGGEGQVQDVNAAADRYVAMCNTVSGATRTD